ncbi:hypothetical protein BDW66DRAFT_145960 [Aspergillus desertorum]
MVHVVLDRDKNGYDKFTADFESIISQAENILHLTSPGQATEKAKAIKLNCLHLTAK